MLYLQQKKLRQKKITLTDVGMQQLPDIEKTDSKEEIFRLKGNIYKGRKYV